MCFFYIRFQFIKDLIESDVCLEWEQNEIEEKGILFPFFRILGMPMVCQGYANAMLSLDFFSTAFCRWLPTDSLAHRVLVDIELYRR